MPIEILYKKTSIYRENRVEEKVNEINEWIIIIAKFKDSLWVLHKIEKF